MPHQQANYCILPQLPRFGVVAMVVVVDIFSDVFVFAIKLVPVVGIFLQFILLTCRSCIVIVCRYSEVWQPSVFLSLCPVAVH